MIKIALCDDEQKWRDEIKTLVSEYTSEHMDMPVRVSVFDSGKSLLEAAEKNGGFDLYVLDVVMPEPDGIDTGVRLREAGDEGLIIYLTTSREYAVESYIAGAFYYLIKPVEKGRFFEVMGKAMEVIGNRRSGSIFVKTKTDVQALRMDEILYVELTGKALRYYLRNGEAITSISSRVSFSEATDELTQDERFVKCGASFVINLYYVKSVEKDGVVFTDEKRLALPKKACGPLRSSWLDYWFSGEEG